MVLLDADIDCPASLAAELRDRASSETALDVYVIFPKVEIEAWILAGVDSIRGFRRIRADASPPADVEAVRDAKRALSNLMDGSRGYVATDDLAAFFSRLDLGLTASRSPSFAKFARDVARIAGA